MKGLDSFLWTNVGAILSLMMIPHPLLGFDHNNLDAGFPLSFDDAESIGFGEQSLEFGTSLLLNSDRDAGARFDLEYLYGFALNTHLFVGIDPQVGGRVNSDNTGFDVGDLSIGVFHNFNREFDHVPAFAIKADVGLPTGDDSQGLDFQLRGIASKTIGQYNRFHLNLDLNLHTATDSGDRSVIPGIILGYSRPLGYPRQFDTTFLAELGIKLSQQTENGAMMITGAGIRKQVGNQSVLDFGVEGDIATNGGDSELRLTVGYSLSF